MSNYRTHFFFNLVIFIPFVYLINKYFYYDVSTFDKILNFSILFSISVIFTLWPDIDIKSIGQKYFYVVFFVTDIILIATNKINEAALLGLLTMLPMITNHRGFFHSLFAVFFFPSIFLIAPMIYYKSFTISKMLIGIPYYLAGVVGYFGHYLLDGIFWKNIKRKIL